MADVINLRQARKQQARAEKEKIAAENRAKHGRSKADRRHDAAKKVLELRKLDGALRDASKPKDLD